MNPASRGPYEGRCDAVQTGRLFFPIVCSLLCPEQYISLSKRLKKKGRKTHTVFCLDLSTALYWCSMVSTLVTVTGR